MSTGDHPFMPMSFRRFRAAIAVTLLGAGLLASACASRPAPLARDLAYDLEPTAYGSFLAARYAGKVGAEAVEAQYYRDALARNAHEPILVEHAFISALSNGDVATAERLAKSALGHAPTDRLARLVLAGRALRLERYRTAIDWLESEDLGPFNRVVGAMMLAWAYVGAGDRARALELLEGPADAPMLVHVTLTHRALILDGAGRGGQAEAAYRAGLSTGVLRATATDAYGRFLERAGRAQEATALYLAQGRQDPQDGAAAAGLRRIARSERPARLVETPAEGASLGIYGPAAAVAANAHLDLAIVYLQLALAVDPGNGAARRLLGDLFSRDGAHEQALAVLAAGDEKDVDLQVAQAWVLARLGRYPDAVQTMEAAAAGGDRRAVLALGDLYAALERPQDAERLYTALIEAAGDRSRALPAGPPGRAWARSSWAMMGGPADLWLAHYARALVRERDDRWPEAEADLRAALEMTPDNPVLLNHLGYAWVERGERTADALTLLRRAADLSPDNGAIIDSLGWAYFQLGQYETAVTYLERAAALSPQDPVINDHLGDAYWRVGRELEAGFQWARVLGLKPDAALSEAVARKAAEGLPPLDRYVAANP